MTEQSEGQEVKKRPSIFETISKHTERALIPYRGVLQSESEDFEHTDLARQAKERLEKQLSELDILQQMISEMAKGKPVSSVIRLHKRLESSTNPRETFTLRFAPAGEAVPVGPDRMQNQLSLHVNIGAGGESALETLYAIGRSGQEPQIVLDKFFKQSNDQSVQLNTVGVYIDPESERFKVNPQAGITFRHSRGEGSARVGGMVYVGTQPHFAELPQTIPLTDFAYLQKGVAQLVGRSEGK